MITPQEHDIEERELLITETLDRRWEWATHINKFQKKGNTSVNLHCELKD